MCNTQRRGLFSALVFAVSILTIGMSASGQNPQLPRAPRLLWHIDKPNFQQLPAVLGKTLYLGGSALTGHELSTGKEILREKTIGKCWQPTVSGGLVFVRDHKGTLHCVSSDLSRTLWSIDLRYSYHVGKAFGDLYLVASGSELLAVTAGKVLWRHDVESEVAMTPATDGRHVFVGSQQGTVVAVDLQSGKETWRTDTPGEFGYSMPVLDSGVLFMADRGVRGGRKAALNAFDAKSGKLLWSTQFGSTGFSTPHPHGDRVWAGFGVSVAAFDRESGVLDMDGRIKTGRNAFGLPQVVDDVIAFGNLDGNFYVHDLETHELRWRFEVGTDERSQVGAWGMVGDLLIVGTTKGIYAIAESPHSEPAVPGFVLRPADR